MLINYVKLLSDAQGFLFSRTGNHTPIHLISGKDVSLSLSGEAGSLQCDPVKLRQDGLYDTADMVLGLKNVALKMLVRRFLDRFPSSNSFERVYQLSSMLYLLRFSPMDASALIDKINYRANKTKNFKKKKILAHLGHTESFTPRQDRFAPRQRHYRRTKSNANRVLSIKIDYLVGAYDEYIAKLNTPIRLSEMGDGYSFNWDTQSIDIHTVHSGIKRSIALSGVDLYCKNFIAVWGIRNVFCGHIEEQTDETICIRLMNKNLNFYGYICAPISRIKWGEGQVRTCLTFDLPDSHKIPSSNKATAYARLLSLPQ